MALRRIPAQSRKMKDSGSLPSVSPNSRQPMMSFANPGGTTTFEGVFPALDATLPAHSLILWVRAQKER